MQSHISEAPAARAVAGLPRLGFAGLGWIGRHRLEAIVGSGAGMATALCDADTNRLDELQRAMPDARAVTTFEELLQQDLDGIVIATPSALHYQQTKAALEAGFAVFCQKPLARTAAETRELLQLARGGNRLLLVDYSYRYTSALAALRQHLRDGVIGQVFACNLVFHNAYGPDKNWYYRPEMAGGGCLIDLGVHLIDSLFWLFPQADVQRLTAQLFTRGELLYNPATAVEDYAAVQLMLSDGLSTQMSCSWNLPAGREALIEMTFYGTEGGLSFHNVNGSFYDFVLDRFNGTQTQRLVEPPDEWGGRAAVDWAERLGRGEGYSPDADSYARVAETIERVYQIQGQ